VVSCVDGTPIEGAKLTIAEASTDPSMTTTETSNYYYGASEADGSFGVMTGSSEPTAWAAKASKNGFKDNAVRYEVGELTHDICLEPEK
jgi:hypothetical protein